MLFLRAVSFSFWITSDTTIAFLIQAPEFAGLWRVANGRASARPFDLRGGWCLNVGLPVVGVAGPSDLSHRRGTRCLIPKA